jgi:hypothetical protein
MLLCPDLEIIDTQSLITTLPVPRIWEVDIPDLTIEVIDTSIDVVEIDPDTDALLVVIGATGPAGPPGPGGGVAELYDTNTPNPPGAPFPYLRFERDIDGDVQAVYLGTST